MSKELDLDDVAATSDLATTELMRLRGERDDAQARIRELEAERDKLIKAVADHVTVREEQYRRIKDLEALNETRLGEIRTTLKLLAEARRDAIEAKQDVADLLRIKTERDALLRKLELTKDALGRIVEISVSYMMCDRKMVSIANAALAAVREPVSQHVPGEQHRVETDTHTIVLGNPPEEPDDWPEDDSRRHNCDAMGCGRAHVLARIRKPPSSPAGEGGDRV